MRFLIDRFIVDLVDQLNSMEVKHHDWVHDDLRIQLMYVLSRKRRAWQAQSTSYYYCHASKLVQMSMFDACKITKLSIQVVSKCSYDLSDDHAAAKRSTQMHLQVQPTPCSK